MRYLTVVAHITEVVASDGSKVNCNYLKHKRFSHSCGLCMGLHYVFVRFASNRTYSKVYEIRMAINLFLDYVINFEEKNPKVFYLDAFIKITSEHFIAYNQFLLKLEAQKSLATRLKGALLSVARDFDEELPLLTLPLINAPKSVSRAPLDEDTNEQLNKALMSHIDEVYEKLHFRTLVNDAEPFDLDELINTDFSLLGKKLCNERILKTLILNGHPFSISYQNYKHSIKNKKGNIKEIKDVVDAIYLYFFINKNASSQLNFEQVLQLYFSTAVDQVVIGLFIMKQTGWNKETLMALDGNNFEHVLTGAVTSDQSLIVSEKNKSQNNKKPFKRPKKFLALSNKTDKYSVYNLIVLARKLSEPFVDLPIEAGYRASGDKYNYLFLCMTPITTWGKGSSSAGRYISVSYKKRWQEGIKEFFLRYEIKEKGERLRVAQDINGRLRPSWIKYTRDNKKHPLSLIAFQQGHADVETTDIYYDSSGPAMQERQKRLRVELNSILSLLQERKFKGLINNKGKQQVYNDLFRIFTIPGHEKALWICTNSFKPDWDGHKSIISDKNKCTQISKCLFCSRVCIVEDSLPFLMERLDTLKNELESTPETEFNSPLMNEIEIIQYILQEWNDESALKEAVRYLRRRPRLLPRDIQSLAILFED